MLAEGQFQEEGISMVEPAGGDGLEWGRHLKDLSSLIGSELPWSLEVFKYRLDEHWTPL